ncbi:MAG: CDP-diacylglycerol--serine O-phosphatidyltransferase, partial [Synergistetes bacterium]|nr:CDP-diacylglycerol--serine O-phosphatidyltransferase [Synergistota bacterium]
YATYLFYYGVVGALVASSFVVFGALRLARFNIQNISEYFIGLPIPSGGGLLAGIVLSNYAFHPSLVMGLVIVTGIMMVSEFRYANLKHLDKNSVDWKRFFMFMSGIGLLVLLLRGKLVLAVFLVYLISGPLGVNWEKMVIKDHYQMDKNEEDTEGEEV